MTHKRPSFFIVSLVLAMFMMTSCKAQDAGPTPWRSKERAGKLLFAFDEKGKPINKTVYRLEYLVTYGFSDEAIPPSDVECKRAIKSTQDETLDGGRTRSNVIRGSSHIVLGSLWSKYYEEIAIIPGPKRISRYSTSANINMLRGVLCSAEKDQADPIRRTNLNFRRVAALPAIRPGIRLSNQALVATYRENGRTVCRIEVALEGNFIRSTQVTYVSNARWVPTLQEVEQLACIHRGAMVNAGYFGYLNIPAEALVDPRLVNRHRSPVYTADEFKDRTLADTPDAPFNMRGLTTDTDRLKGLLGEDDVPPGFRYSDLGS